MPRKRKFTRDEQNSRVARILEGLDLAYPSAECALIHRSAFQLLIATILSAQCTDERVNIVTRDLFRKYKSPQDSVRVAREVLEDDIRPTGFFRNKARSIQGACRMIIEDFGGS